MKRTRRETQGSKRDVRALEVGELAIVIGGVMTDGHGHGKGGPDPGGGGGKSRH